MKEFTLPGFIAFLGTLAVEQHMVNHHALEKAARIVEHEAKDVIGTYRYGWPPLAESTLAKKSADTPLLETGEMRDSIEHRVHANSHGGEANIGSDNQKAVWHELGTNKAPPRSFLAGALTHKIHEVVDVIGSTVHASLIGESVAGANSLIPGY